MSQVKKRYIKFGDTSSADNVNAQALPATNTAVNYTPSNVGSEGTDKVSAHLKGIDTKLGTISSGGAAGDILETSFSAANNQSSPANITGFSFANATVRSFDALVSVYINATSSLYEVFKLQGIQKAAGWDMAVTSVGDTSGIILSIDSTGHIQYTSSNSAGFVATKISFRAITTTL